ncbi:hypothetical protein GYA28_01090 [Candidatus Roizmanbacteria bacterium]|nr:hypothetical protein [Candidatus Roizmanbacteria bacterium]
MKSSGTIVFYAFLVIFVTLAYLYNNNLLSFLPKNDTQVKSSRAEVEFKDKAFRLDFSKKYDGYSTEAASFEETEKWSGVNFDNFEYDDITFFDGKTSLDIVSKNSQNAAVKMQRNLDLNDYEIIKMLVYSPKVENSDNIKNLTLTFNTSNNNSFEYDITNLKTGWNLVKMPKNTFSSTQKMASSSAGWDRIKDIQVSLVSRPSTKVELNLDRIWAEKDESYQDYLLTNNENMLSLKEFQGKNYLFINNFGGLNSVIKKVTSVKNFTYIVKIIPIKKGVFGLGGRFDFITGYGYFMEFTGINSGNWQFYKLSKPNADNSPITQLDSGTITNYQIDIGKPIWVKMAFESKKISAYFSLDGQNFTRLTEKNDGEIASGGIGFFSKGGGFLLESVDFTQ